MTALVALLFTWMSVDQSRTELRIAEQGQITNRFTAAINNLGSNSEDVRLGGIYALQRIMLDSARDQPTIVTVLTAYARRHARVPASGFAKETQEEIEQSLESPVKPAADVQAVLSVLADRPADHDERASLDLRHTDLRGAEVFTQRPKRSAAFRAAAFDQADLRHSTFDGVDLRKVGAGLDQVATDRRGAASVAGVASSVFSPSAIRSYTSWRDTSRCRWLISLTRAAFIESARWRRTVSPRRTSAAMDGLERTSPEHRVVIYSECRSDEVTLEKLGVLGPNYPGSCATARREDDGTTVHGHIQIAVRATRLLVQLDGRTDRNAFSSREQSHTEDQLAADLTHAELDVDVTHTHVRPVGNPGLPVEIEGVDSAFTDAPAVYKH
ncbi:hypothetical protein ACIO7M_12620 [Streptomyces toxytricini]|uniref:Pentapeptide repeat-containing protein n=1 Tax=Streptomyces toxytricini TaxID=67369 RepID=A0ABW8EFD5_STRT5